MREEPVPSRSTVTATDVSLVVRVMVAVVSIPDPSAGVKIVAYLTAQPGRRPTIVELKMFCGTVLPAYMNPDAFVFLDALPRTSTDKVDYQALLRLNQAPPARVGA